MPASKNAQKKVDNVTTETTETTETKKTTKNAKNTVPTQETTAKKEIKPKTKKETTKTTTETTTTTPVAEVQNVVVAVDTEASITNGFTEFISKFQAMLAQFSTLKAELKVLERKTMKELKVVQKINNKKKRKGTRAPSGFVKPAPISSQLAKFLGKPEGSEMARTDVTREINKYIRANNLQDKENGRKINPDKQLSDLLNIDKNSDVVLTYFNLQRYMGPHFPKQTKPAVTA